MHLYWVCENASSIRCVAPARFSDGYLVAVTVDGQRTAFASKPLAYPSQLLLLSFRRRARPKVISVTLQGSNFGSSTTADRLVIEFTHPTFKSGTCKVTKVRERCGVHRACRHRIWMEMKITVLPVGIEDGGIAGNLRLSSLQVFVCVLEAVCAAMSSLGLHLAANPSR